MIIRNTLSSLLILLSSSSSLAWSIKVIQFDGSKAQTKVFKLSDEQSYEPKDLLGIACFAATGEITSVDKKEHVARDLTLECRETSRDTRFNISVNCTKNADGAAEMLVKPAKFTTKTPQYSLTVSCK